MPSKYSFRTLFHMKCGPRYLRRYSDRLRAGRSGDRIPVVVRFSAPVKTGPGAHPVSCSTGTGPSPGGKSGRACTVQLYLYSPYGPYSLYRTSVPLQHSYTSTPPMGRTACTESQCLYSTAIPLQYSLTRLLTLQTPS